MRSKNICFTPRPYPINKANLAVWAAVVPDSATCPWGAGAAVISDIDPIASKHRILVVRSISIKSIIIVVNLSCSKHCKTLIQFKIA